jgi:hypothetical protein
MSFNALAHIHWQDIASKNASNSHCGSLFNATTNFVDIICCFTAQGTKASAAVSFVC